MLLKVFYLLRSTEENAYKSLNPQVIWKFSPERYIQ